MGRTLIILGDTVCVEIRPARRDESASFCGFPVAAGGSGKTFRINSKFLAAAVPHGAARPRETRFVCNLKIMTIGTAHTFPARGQEV